MHYKHLNINYNSNTTFPLVKGKSILYPKQILPISETINSQAEIGFAKTDPYKYVVVVDNKILKRTNDLYGCLAIYRKRDGNDIFTGLYGFSINSITTTQINFAVGEIIYRIDDDILEIYRSRVKRSYYYYFKMKRGLPPTSSIRKRNLVKNSFDMLKVFNDNKETNIDFVEFLALESEYDRLELIRTFLQDTYGIH